MTPARVGERAPDVSEGYQSLTPPLPTRDLFRLLSATVVPRPIAWTSTVDAEGVRNLAPFSYFTVVSTDPPMLGINIEDRPDGSPKDTLRNIEASAEFVVNTVDDEDARLAQLTADDDLGGGDIFTRYGIEALGSSKVRPPRVAGAAVSMECRLESISRPGGDNLVIGRVVAFHVARRVLNPAGDIDIPALHAAARVGARFASLTRYRSVRDD